MASGSSCTIIRRRPSSPESSGVGSHIAVYWSGPTRRSSFSFRCGAAFPKLHDLNDEAHFDGFSEDAIFWQACHQSAMCDSKIVIGEGARQIVLNTLPILTVLSRSDVGRKCNSP